MDYRLSPPISNQELNKLFAAAWHNHSPSNFELVLSRSLAHVCAYCDNQLVGFVNLAWDGGIHAFLLDPTVHPDFQHRGIGKNLIEIAAQEAKRKGIEWIHVDFEPHLAPFYSNCSFKPTMAGLRNLKSEASE